MIKVIEKNKLDTTYNSAIPSVWLCIKLIALFILFYFIIDVVFFILKGWSNSNLLYYLFTRRYSYLSLLTGSVIGIFFGYIFVKCKKNIKITLTKSHIIIHQGVSIEIIKYLDIVKVEPLYKKFGIKLIVYADEGKRTSLKKYRGYFISTDQANFSSFSDLKISGLVNAIRSKLNKKECEK